MFRQYWEKTEGFSAVLNARVTKVTDNAVFYIDEKGDEQSVQADSVVLSVGMKSKTEEAYSFYNTSPRHYVIGDCFKVGSVQECMRQGYATARMI